MSSIGGAPPSPGRAARPSSPPPTAGPSDPSPSASTTAGPTPTGPTTTASPSPPATTRPTPWSPSPSDDWCSFAWELRTCFALFYADALTFPRGNFGQLARWEPSLRVAFDGQAVYDLDDPPPVLDDAGTASRPRTAPSPSTTPTPRWSTSSNGPAFSISAMSSTPASWTLLRADVHRRRRAGPTRRPAFVVDDGRRRRHLQPGQLPQRPVRPDRRPRCRRTLPAASVPSAVPIYARRPTVSTATASSSRCPGPPRAWPTSPGTVTAAWAATRSNAPCSTSASSSTPPPPAPANSWFWPAPTGGPHGSPVPTRPTDLPVVALTTEPGDVTVHFGHTLHAAPPPTDRTAAGRRALYLSYVPPLTFEMIGPGQGYNDVLFTRDAGPRPARRRSSLRGVLPASTKRRLPTRPRPGPARPRPGPARADR